MSNLIKNPKGQAASQNRMQAVKAIRSFPAPRGYKGVMIVKAEAYQLNGNHAGNSERHFPIDPDPATPWTNTEYRFPTPSECVESTAEYLRIPFVEVDAIRKECEKAFKQGADSVASSLEVSPMAEEARTKAGNAAAKACFARFIETLRPQWQTEAQKGIELIQSLSNA